MASTWAALLGPASPSCLNLAICLLMKTSLLMASWGHDSVAGQHLACLLSGLGGLVSATVRVIVYLVPPRHQWGYVLLEWTCYVLSSLLLDGQDWSSSYLWQLLWSSTVYWVVLPIAYCYLLKEMLWYLPSDQQSATTTSEESEFEAGGQTSSAYAKSDLMHGRASTPVRDVGVSGRRRENDQQWKAQQDTSAIATDVLPSGSVEEANSRGTSDEAPQPDASPNKSSTRLQLDLAKLLQSAGKQTVNSTRLTCYQSRLRTRMISVKIPNHPGDFTSFANLLQDQVEEVVHQHVGQQLVTHQTVCVQGCIHLLMTLFETGGEDPVGPTKLLHHLLEDLPSSLGVAKLSVQVDEYQGTRADDNASGSSIRRVDATLLSWGQSWYSSLGSDRKSAGPLILWGCKDRPLSLPAAAKCLKMIVVHGGKVVYERAIQPESLAENTTGLRVLLSPDVARLPHSVLLIYLVVDTKDGQSVWLSTLPILLCPTAIMHELTNWQPFILWDYDGEFGRRMSTSWALHHYIFSRVLLDMVPMFITGLAQVKGPERRMQGVVWESARYAIACLESIGLPVMVSWLHYCCELTRWKSSMMALQTDEAILAGCPPLFGWVPPRWEGALYQRSNSWPLEKLPLHGGDVLDGHLCGHTGLDSRC